MEGKIKKFIEDNNLDFTSEGSGLNSNCVILAGYGLYLGIESYSELSDILDTIDPDQELIPASADTELNRVFDYANKNMYGNWWKNEEAHTIYKF